MQCVSSSGWTVHEIPMTILVSYIKCRADEPGTAIFQIQHPLLTEPVAVRAITHADAVDALDAAVEADWKINARFGHMRKKRKLVTCMRCDGSGEVEE